MTAWIMPWGNLSSFHQGWPGLADKFFGPGSFVAGGTPIPVLEAQPVKPYTSITALAVDASPPQWVLYDPEHWDATPWYEQQHPAGFIHAFGTLAAARGLRCVAAPSLDLITSSGADCPLLSGEKLSDGYLRCKIPFQANSFGVLLCQSQSLQSNTAQFSSLINAVRAGMPAQQKLWAALTSSGASALKQMQDCYAANAGFVDGWWLNTTISTLSTVAAFLQSLP